MGCPCELRLPSDHAPALIEQCMAEVRRFEHKYSRYRSDSVISKINHSAGADPVSIDNETAQLLEYADTCFQISDGLFDITSGVLRSIWNQDSTSLPDQDTLLATTALIGWEKVKRTHNTVYLPRAGMQLDLGGVVKEYVADSLIALMQGDGVAHALVNLGGDIAVLGSQPDGQPWPIGIANPAEPSTPIAIARLTGGAITTSGGYERFVEIDGQRYSHLLNPATGLPVDNLVGVSILAPQAIVAGSLSTVALLKAEAEALAWLEDCGAPYLAIDKNNQCFGSLATDQT